MEFLTHLNSFLQQSASPLRNQFQEQDVYAIAQLANSDSFVGKKLNHIESYIDNNAESIDTRVSQAFSEYKEAVTYINISKEF